MKKRKPDVRKTTDETLALAKAGDKRAIADVFYDADTLARWWASKYSRGNDAQRDDLHSIGRVAVFDAIRTYQPRRGGWASWVTQWMKAKMWASFNLAHTRHEVRGVTADAEDAVESADEQLERLQTEVALRRSVAKLPSHLRRIMQARLEGKTLQSIGDELSRSRERIRQLEVAGRTRLRKALEAA